MSRQIKGWLISHHPLQKFFTSSPSSSSSSLLFSGTPLQAVADTLPFTSRTICTRAHPNGKYGLNGAGSNRIKKYSINNNYPLSLLQSFVPSSFSVRSLIHTSLYVSFSTGTTGTSTSSLGTESPQITGTHLEKLSFRAKETPPGVVRLVERYSRIPEDRIRNFSVIAHIDHGKSTLSDKVLESTGNIWPTTKHTAQVLDTLQVERQRGITVKAQSASMIYVDPVTKQDYLFNLIDTPGHIDFSYEVSRSLAACQGALLLCDCTQSVQAQTVANYNTAKEANLKLIPVLTKIDLPSADPEPALIALEAAFGFDPNEAIWTSAKTGSGINELFPAIIKRIPAPAMIGARNSSLRCLLFDSWYDEYRGVVCCIQVIDGTLKPGDVIVSAHSGDKFTVQEVGLMAPTRVPVPLLASGHIGYVLMGMKDTRQARVGDTFMHIDKPVPALPGFRPSKPMVFASLYPVDTGDFNALQTAVERLTLNDASVTIEKESSGSLGFGLRCGFLGLLHMDVFNQRLQDEFSMPVIITAPTVAYKVLLRNGKEMICERPIDFPPDHEVEKYYEPTAHVSIMAPSMFVSPLLSLLNERRGIQEDIIYLNQGNSGGNTNNKQSEAALMAQAYLAAIPSTSSSANSYAKEKSSVSVEGIQDAELNEEEQEEDEEEETDDEDMEEEEDGNTNTTGGLTSSSASSSSPLLNSVGHSLASSNDRVVLKYLLPWAEVVSHLYDKVKSLTAGYASMDWLPGDMMEADIVKVDILMNGKSVDALCFIAHRDKAQFEGRKVAQKLKSVINRQQFEIIIQAAIGIKVIARERIAPYRKDVLASGKGTRIGGGDKSRKQKLLARQKEGKRRMKTVGNIELSQEAFHSILSRSE